MRLEHATSIAALVVVVLAMFALQRALEFRTAGPGFYATEPQHPWNRLHSTLIVRHARGGQRFGDRELDPLLWPDSTHLLSRGSFERTLHVLDEFRSRGDALLIRDPMKRAMLQHDLWGVFDWLNAPDAVGFPQQRAALSRRLAQLIRQLALSANEIERLPNNYALAVQANGNAQQLGDSNTDHPALPADLLNSDGPWRQLAYRFNGRIGTAHEENTATAGRSAFLMFVRLPDEQPDIVSLINRFNAWADEEASQDAETRRRAGYPPFEFQEGTRIALVRRMLVIDDRGTIRPTHITERVQLRVLEEQSEQWFQLFSLNRRALVGGNPGRSLVLISNHERGFELGPIRTPTAGDPFPFASKQLPPTVLMDTCSQCHKHHGLLSLARDRFSSLGSRPANLSVTIQEGVDADATAVWKASRPEFLLLRQFMEADRGSAK